MRITRVLRVVFYLEGSVILQWLLQEHVSCSSTLAVPWLVSVKTWKSFPNILMQEYLHLSGWVGSQHSLDILVHRNCYIVNL